MKKQFAARWVPVLTFGFLALLAAPTLSEEEGKKSSRTSMSTALSKTHVFTLTLEEDGQKYDFSLALASRHFTMNLGEKNIRLRGQLWQQEDGREMLDYTLEFTQWVSQDSGGRQRSGSTWRGSAYLRDGQLVEIVRFLNGSFSVELSALR